MTDIGSFRMFPHLVAAVFLLALAPRVHSQSGRSHVFGSEEELRREVDRRVPPRLPLELVVEDQQPQASLDQIWLGPLQDLRNPDEQENEDEEDTSSASASGSSADDFVYADHAKQFRMKATPELIDDGGDVIITYFNVESPHAKDFIGVSCGPQLHPNDFFLQRDVASPDVLPNSVRFSALYMMRCNYTFSYQNFQPKFHDFKPLGQLTVAMKDAFQAPKHGHISFTSQQDEMAVMFNSASDKTPQVRFGLSPNDLIQTASGTSSTYQASDMCHEPANITSQQFFRDPGFMHKVILHNLAPGKRYFYQFGNEEDGWSAISSFRSRPKADVKSAKFLAYADMGVDDAPRAMTTALRSFQDVVDGYDNFLLHFGDISYARGNAHVWDTFFHIIEPYATRVPYLVSIGNHEYDYIAGGEHDPSGATGADGRMAFHPLWANYGSDSSGECSVPMYHRWHTPSNGNSIYWYSFNYGGVHVIQMSSEHDWTRGSKQYNWIQEDLKQVDRDMTPWIILTAHRMMYTTQLKEERDLEVANHMRDELEDLLVQHRVNLMLVGHQHSYERSCAVRDGKCVADGKAPVHIVVGSAGAGLEEGGFSKDIGEWSVAHVNDWGYLRLDTTEQEMTIQFILNRNGAVYDEVTLKPW